MESNLLLPNQTPGLVPQNGGIWRGATHWKYEEDGKWDPNTFEEEFQKPLHIYRTFKHKGITAWEEKELEFVKKGGIIFWSIQSFNWAEDTADPKYEIHLKKIAEQIKLIKPAKILVAPGYEPDGHCAPFANKRETFGTAEEYVAYRMKVKQVFDDEGCDNVIYLMDLSNKCSEDPGGTGTLIPKLFPTDGSVQFLFWNLFQMQDDKMIQNKIKKGETSKHWDSKYHFDWFYKYFSDETNPSYHIWKDIPWGIGAWGSLQMNWHKTRNLTHEDRQAYIKQITEAQEDPKHPKMKASIWFDSLESIITAVDPKKIKHYVNKHDLETEGLGSAEMKPDITNYLHNSKFLKADEHLK